MNETGSTTKTHILRLLTVLCFLTLFLLSLHGFTNIFRNKNEADIMLPYYDEPKNSLDIVFVGSSHFMCGIYPMELYENYGYTSYVFASSAQVMPQSYYQVIETLRTQSPQLIVLDMGELIYEEKHGSEAYTHVQVDNMPWSANKINLIQDLFRGEEKLPYYVNLVQYHTRWKILMPDDFDPITTLTKGAFYTEDVTPMEPMELPKPDETLAPPEVAQEYLQKIIDLCRERNVELLLLNLPLYTEVYGYQQINTGVETAAANGVHFLNLLYHQKELELDTQTDFRDIFHLNAKGAKKATDYLGAYIEKNYNINKAHTDAVENSWREALAAYREAYPDAA